MTGTTAYQLGSNSTHCKDAIWLQPARRWLLALVLLHASSSSVAAPAHTEAELIQWSNDTLSAAIAEHRASGIAVAIVKDGSLIYSNGYGQADESGKAVDPRETPFSIGSITKCFTATAVAQLLESGVIRSLDDPANTYLHRIQLPAKNGRNVTVHDLVTHRGGFDESIYGLATLTAVPVPITPAEILGRLPPIIRTPGEISVYSNIGYGVLGILIEDATGLTYGEYLKQRVFNPLTMSHSFVRYDPKQAIAHPMEFSANGTASPIPQAWAYHPFISSSASIVSTAEDMSRFAIGQLDAELGTVPALMSAATARLVHDRSTANAPRVAGFGMSFIANTWNGTRITENAGSGPGFQALFILLPDMRTGFIALIMGGGHDSLKMFALREQFLNYYLRPLQPSAGSLGTVPMQHYAGIYRSERRPHSTSEAIFNPGTTLEVRAAGSGNTLEINGESDYREIAAGAFWKPGIAPYIPDDASSDLYVFVPDEDGKIKYVAPYLSVDVYKPAYLDPATVQWITIVLCIVCGTGLLGILWPIASRTDRITQVLAVLLGVCTLGVPGVIAGALKVYGNPAFMLGLGHILPLQIAAVLASAAGVFIIGLIVLFILNARRSRGSALVHSRVARWHLVGLCGAGCALMFAFAHYNLIGYHVP